MPEKQPIKGYAMVCETHGLHRIWRNEEAAEQWRRFWDHSNVHGKAIACAPHVLVPLTPEGE